MARTVLRRLAKPLGEVVAKRWPPASRLFVIGDGAAWSIDHDALEIAKIARGLGAKLASRRLLNVSRDQAVFFASHLSF
jgi:hypothetical protein